MSPTPALVLAALLVAVPPPIPGAQRGAQAPPQPLEPIPASGVGSAKVVPIQVTGDAASRFTLVVLADGYAAKDLPAFRQDLDKHLNILWSIEPFTSYRNYFNVYAIEAVSQDTGLTCDPILLQEPNMDEALRKQLQQRNTVFGLQFGGGCTNVNARGVTPRGGLQAKVRQYAALATESPDQILVIGNSRSYGGIGGGIATSTGSNALSPLITPHEIGHSLGRLQDEYTYGARGVAGGTYKGGEPNSTHMTLLTEDEMKAKQLKWWRWLGEPSESGGVIGRYEGGSGNTKGIWRPSKHSMMISLGYFFDQVSLEQMVRQISSRVGLIAASTPADRPVQITDTVWVVPAHPVYHELTIAWQVGDRVIPNPQNLPYLNLGSLQLTDDPKEVSVRVVDPTPFVRDPHIRDTVLTATMTWRIENQAARGTPAAAGRGIGGSTQTSRPVGGRDVVYIEPDAPSGGRPDLAALASATWRLNGAIVPEWRGRWSVDLASRKLAPGSHTLVVSVGQGRSGNQAETRRWTIDNTMPTVAYTLSKHAEMLPAGPDGEPHFVFVDEFTMKLEPKDDRPGYVVAEFRVNGDGWHHYYGWPDAPPGTPFKFTPRGTNIKELIYGSLSSEGLSPQPWEPREPGFGTHRIEYRAKDAAGNIGPVGAFRVTLKAR